MYDCPATHRDCSSAELYQRSVYVNKVRRRRVYNYCRTGGGPVNTGARVQDFASDAGILPQVCTLPRQVRFPGAGSHARHGDKIVTIIPHAFAQGLCGAIDQWDGFVKKDEDETGPAHDAYCRAAGHVAADHWPLDLDQLIHAFHNPGGPFLREGR